MPDSQTTSGETSGSLELKAGHAPALKIGGMRVGAGRPRQTSQGDDKEKNTSSEGDNATTRDKERSTGNNHQNDDEDIDDDEQRSGAVSNRVAGQMVSGSFVPVQKAFPTEAVKHIHDKSGTHPRHEIHNHTKHEDQRFLNQPRKQ